MELKYFMWPTVLGLALLFAKPNEISQDSTMPADTFAEKHNVARVQSSLQSLDSPLTENDSVEKATMQPMQKSSASEI